MRDLGDEPEEDRGDIDQLGQRRGLRADRRSDDREHDLRQDDKGKRDSGQEPRLRERGSPQSPPMPSKCDRLPIESPPFASGYAEQPDPRNACPRRRPLAICGTWTKRRQTSNGGSATRRCPMTRRSPSWSERAAAIRAGSARECVWLLEHPPLFTAGTSADPAELSNPQGFPVYEAGRGGRYTYHGPGQRVGYVMLDLEKRGKDIRRFVHALEGWMIDTLAELGVAAHRAEGASASGSAKAPDEAKIGALGVRVKRWVTLHGFALNVAPDLSHFAGIVPCGIAEFRGHEPRRARETNAAETG